MEWTVTEAAELGERFDKHLARRLSDMSRSRLQDLIKDGHATLNGKPVKSGATMRAGDVVSVTVPEPVAVPVSSSSEAFAAPARVTLMDAPLHEASIPLTTTVATL